MVFRYFYILGPVKCLRLESRLFMSLKYEAEMCQYEGVAGEYAHLAELVKNYRERHGSLDSVETFFHLREWNYPTITDVLEAFFGAFKKSAVATRSSLPDVYTDVD